MVSKTCCPRKCIYKPLGADPADGTALLLLALWGKLLKRPIQITVNFNLDSVNNNPLFVSSNNTLAANNSTNNNSLLSVSNDNILTVNSRSNKNRFLSVASATILKTTCFLSTTIATKTDSFL